LIGSRLICLALLASWPALAPAAPAGRADFASETASADTRRLADWVVATGDARGLPFVIVDKVAARVFAFDGGGLLRGAAPALLGLAKGDVSPPGVGNARLADIAPAQRITPAGRFEAGLGSNFGPKDIIWVDYDAAISLHRVVTTKAGERRLQRLATPSASDNRISYGCINVPAAFYDGIVQPLFRPANGIVYILPETRSLDELFALNAPPSEVLP
jgi:hypothetical protein